MATSLLNTISGLLTPDLINQAASSLGESGPTVSKGMEAIVPVLLGSTAKRATDPGFAGTLLNLVNEPANDGSLLNNLSSAFGSGAGSGPMQGLGERLLSMLFGGNRSNLVNTLASYVGAQPSTINSLLSVAAPMVLSVLGKVVKSGNLNASSLSGLLASQVSDLTARLPAGLSSVSSFITQEPARAAAAVAAPIAAQKSSIGRWLLPAIIVIAAIWLLPKFFAKHDSTTGVVQPSPSVSTISTPALSTAISKPSVKLYFQVGDAVLPTGSTDTLSPVVSYLAGNPTARVSISGYHDPSGDAATNNELAKNRAVAVRSALLAAGVSASQIELREPIVATAGGSAEESRRVEVTVY